MDDLDRFLAEDLGPGPGPLERDVTTRAIARGEHGRARIVAQEDGTAAGLAEASSVFARLGVKAEHVARDGQRVVAGQEMLRVTGPVAAILAGERLALNLVMRMAGIATLTRRCVDLAHAVNPRCEVAATRKTTPGFRAFEKRAVELGGGVAHRQGLFDAVLVKDNHLVLAGSVAEALRRVRASGWQGPIEVEADTEEQAREAMRLGADWVLLDNWGPRRLAEGAPALRKLGSGKIEASGGILPEAVGAYAPWVDRVSLGALTHSARALPASLELLAVER
ncbi:MAG: carboxylating nicotinate-nucleotide diphosphorylase [Halobacteriales archaeon]|nr:carboxylating nicotinate-nucleotide diphosphorylase [Halobacteriales archaeon]